MRRDKNLIRFNNALFSFCLFFLKPIIHLNAMLKKPFPPTIVMRHQRENLKKCSLRGLEMRPDFKFLTYPFDPFPAKLTSYILLAFDGPLMSEKDQDCGLIILDATWRYAEKMFRQLPLSHIPLRSLPPALKTAYPRRQNDCSHPGRGLASIEAIFASYFLLKRDLEGLLNHYHWKIPFLENNPLFTPLLPR